jgi:hypothetical protein
MVYYSMFIKISKKNVNKKQCARHQARETQNATNLLMIHMRFGLLLLDHNRFSWSVVIDRKLISLFFLVIINYCERSTNIF